MKSARVQGSLGEPLQRRVGELSSEKREVEERVEEVMRKKR